MALEKYRMQDYTPDQPESEPVSSPQTYQEKFSQLGGVKIRLSSNTINFDTLRGSQILDEMRHFFLKNVEISLEQCHDFNRLTIPPNTWYRQHLVILTANDSLEAALEDAVNVSNEQTQSGMRQYYYNHTQVYIFGWTEDHTLDLEKYISPRLQIDTYTEPFAHGPDIYAVFAKRALKQILDFPYLAKQEGFSLHIPTELASVAASLSRHQAHYLIQNMSSGLVVKAHYMLHLKEQGVPHVLNAWPEEYHVKYWGDTLPPENLKAIVETFQLETPFPLTGWFIYDSVPEAFYKATSTIIFPSALEQLPQAGEIYQMVGRLMTSATPPEIVPLIYQENGKALLLLLNAQLKNWDLI